jgi:hypothetical protein
MAMEKMSLPKAGFALLSSATFGAGQGCIIAKRWAGKSGDDVAIAGGGGAIAGAALMGLVLAAHKQNPDNAIIVGPIAAILISMLVYKAGEVATSSDEMSEETKTYNWKVFTGAGGFLGAWAMALGIYLAYPRS